jgi:hypothetical protein
MQSLFLQGFNAAAKASEQTKILNKKGQTRTSDQFNKTILDLPLYFVDYFLACIP